MLILNLLLTLQSNTYQSVVITDGSSTYTVFTYLCDDLDNTTLGGRIGYYNDSCNFVEDPSSSAQMSFMVACENEEISLWNNIVYHLTPGWVLRCLLLAVFSACSIYLSLKFPK